MPSEPGSPEPRASLRALLSARGWAPGNDLEGMLTTEEQQAIVAGEPYCYRCGKPASSFAEYDQYIDPCPDRAEAVRHEEGTYNPNTNRFACDECYIAIGMPAGEPGDAYGWKAP